MLIDPLIRGKGDSSLRQELVEAVKARIPPCNDSHFFMVPAILDRLMYHPECEFSLAVQILENRRPLGDGHVRPWRSEALGIWKLFSDIADEGQRQEILDWVHLKENLYKVSATELDLTTVEAFLWQGKVDQAIEQLTDWQDEQAQTFIRYLTNHRSRIVNYAYFQAEGISTGSGTTESTVKQIGHASNSQEHSGKPIMWEHPLLQPSPFDLSAQPKGMRASLQDWDAPKWLN